MVTCDACCWNNCKVFWVGIDNNHIPIKFQVGALYGQLDITLCDSQSPAIFLREKICCTIMYAWTRESKLSYNARLAKQIDVK